MQGFNKYYAPDFDPNKTSSLNAYHGKHALGDRARKIDQGILIVRFEMPWNSWCGTCSAHIGAGVRYNAEKKRQGSYLSTPIWGFRCKCHLCSGWFEIRTDPQNAQYVVHEGLKKKSEDWDPEENGGYAVHDTDAPSSSLPPTDPFASLERTETQKSLTTQRSERLTSLYALSSSTTLDPYTLSSRLRYTFRSEKKVRQGKEREDEGVRERIGLGERVRLLEDVKGEGEEEWKVGRGERERREVEMGRGGMGGSGTRKGKERETEREGEVGGGGGVERIGKIVVGNERKRRDPFDVGMKRKVVVGVVGGGVGKLVARKKKGGGGGGGSKLVAASSASRSSPTKESSAASPVAGLGSLMDGYGSE